MTFCYTHKCCNLIGAALFPVAACNGFDCEYYQALSCLEGPGDEANLSYVRSLLYIQLYIIYIYIYIYVGSAMKKLRSTKLTRYQTSTQSTPILSLKNSQTSCANSLIFREKIKMTILSDGCGYFSVLKNCCSKKVFKGRLVVVSWGTHRSTGKIYHNY